MGKTTMSCPYCNDLWVIQSGHSACYYQADFWDFWENTIAKDCVHHAILLLTHCVFLRPGQVYHSGRSQWEEVAPMPRALTEFHCQLISFNRYRDPWSAAAWCVVDLWSYVCERMYVRVARVTHLSQSSWENDNLHLTPHPLQIIITQDAIYLFIFLFEELMCYAPAAIIGSFLC